MYRSNRSRSRRKHRLEGCTAFAAWVIKQVREYKWSLDACVGYARQHNLFPAGEVVCTRTLYHEIWASNLELSITELPETVKRKQTGCSRSRQRKKNYGKDITEQPELAAQRIEEGYWKGDTVVGKRAGKEAVILSLLEKKPQHYFILRIPWKDSASILQAMQQLKEEYGEQFAQVFKTITANIHTNNRVNDQ